MKPTKKANTIHVNPLTIDTVGLQAITGMGRASAVKIGEAAHAKIKFGRRVVWNIEKVKRYMEEHSA